MLSLFYYKNVVLYEKLEQMNLFMMIGIDCFLNFHYKCKADLTINAKQTILTVEVIYVLYKEGG